MQFKIFFIVFSLLLAINSVEAPSERPDRYSFSNGVMTDNNGMTYQIGGNGYINVNNERYVGFALKGTVDNNTEIHSSMDFEWTWNHTINGNDHIFEAYNNNEAFKWTQYWYFYEDSNIPMKIEHHLENNYANITNTEMYYIMSITNDDVIRYNGTFYDVGEILNGSNIHRTGDFNLDYPQISFSRYFFDFGDLINDGFTINEFYIGDGEVIGKPLIDIVAVGFTKGSGTFPLGTDIWIDPTFDAGNWISDSSIVSGLQDTTWGSSPTVFNDSGTWKLITGKSEGLFDGYYWSGSTWVSDSSIVTGLGDIGTRSIPTLFDDSGTWKLIAGRQAGVFNGWYWNGTSWVGNSSIVAGLGDVGDRSSPTIFNDSGTWKLISGEEDGLFYGYYWSGSTWVSDSSIVTGLGDVGRYSTPTVFDDLGTWRLIAGNQNGIFFGYYWSGSTWVSDSSIITGLGDIGANSNPEVFNDSGTWKLITGKSDGLFDGYYWQPRPGDPINLAHTTGDYWVNFTWALNSVGLNTDSFNVSQNGTWTNDSLITFINTSVGIGGHSEIFVWAYNSTEDLLSPGYLTDNVTLNVADPINLTSTTGKFWVNYTWQEGIEEYFKMDTFNVSQNGSWTNGSAITFINTSVSAHGYSNIIVYGYNSTVDLLSSGYLSDNITVPNNAITITNISDWSDYEGQNVYIDYDATDLDGDTPTFSCNRTDLFTDFNSATGTGNWTSTIGTYYVDFGVSDGYGSTDNYTMTITAASTTPTITLVSFYPSLINTNYTGVITASYMVKSGYPLNYSSLAFLYGVNYTITGDMHSYVKAPENSIAFEGIYRAIYRNRTPYLSWEFNDTITGGNVWQWGGYDNDSVYVSNNPINSTHAWINVTSRTQEILSSSFYIARQSMYKSPKTGFEINKAQGIIIKIWDVEKIRGRNSNYLVGLVFDTDLEATPDSDILIRYCNSSLDPDNDDPRTSPCCQDVITADYARWMNHTWTPHTNSSYSKPLVVDASDFDPTDTGFLYLSSGTVSSKSFVLNATNYDPGICNRTFAQTQTMWTFDEGAGTSTAIAYTPSFFALFARDYMELETHLYIANNQGEWGHSEIDTTPIGLSQYPVDPITFEHFNISCPIEGHIYDNMMDATYDDGYMNIGLYCPGDPDGGNVSHNITVHYENQTLAGIVNNTLITNGSEHVEINFSTTPYYSTTDMYKLKCVSTDDEGSIVTKWLDSKFTLAADGTQGWVKDDMLLFWGMNDIPTLYSTVNNNSYISYNSGNDIYTMHVPFFKSKCNETFYFNETVHLESLNDTNVSYFRFSGCTVFDNATILGWNTTSDTVAPDSDAHRGYLFSCCNVCGDIANSNFSYLGSNIYREEGLNFIGNTLDYLIYNTTLSHNAEGIIMEECSNFNISHCTITDNLNVGIGIYYSNDTIVANNTIDSNGGRSVALYEAHNNIIRYNEITNSGVHGVHYRSNSLNNTCTENDITGSALYDYYLSSSSISNYIIDPASSTNTIRSTSTSSVNIENTDNAVFTEDSLNTSYAYLTNYSMFVSGASQTFNITQYNITAIPSTDKLSIWNMEWDATVKFNVSSETPDNPTWFNLTNSTWASNIINIYRNGTFYASETADVNGLITYNYSDSYSEKWFEFQEKSTFNPPDPISLTNNTGNHWVRYDWSPGSGNVTDSYNVSYNGTWDNTSSNTFINESVGAHGYLEIIVYAWNNSGSGTLSAGYLTDNVTVPNNIPTQSSSHTDLGTHLIDHTPTITWTKGTDVDGDTVTTYIYVGTTSTPTAEEGHTTSETLDLGSTVTLNDGVTYYWRTRSWDGYEYSGYTSSDEFSMNALATTTNLLTAGETNPTEVFNATPTFTWTYSDADSDPQSHWEIYVGTSSGASDMWDSGQLSGADVSDVYAGSSLTRGTLYYVQVRTTDGYEWSTWATGTFTLGTFNPPDPISLTNNTGNHWVRYDWSPGSGNVTDSYNVSYNGTWDNTSSNTFRNESVGAHGFLDIEVYAYNNTGNILSAGSLTDNVTVPNNPINITNTSNYNGMENVQALIDFDYTDVDDDVPVFQTNATVGSLNSSTGVFTWMPTFGDAGTYYFEFNVSDGHGSVDSYISTFEIIEFELTNPNPLDDIYINKGERQTFSISISVLANSTWTLDGELQDITNNSMNPSYTTPDSLGLGEHTLIINASAVPNSSITEEHVWNFTVKTRPATSGSKPSPPSITPGVSNEPLENVLCSENGFIRNIKYGNRISYAVRNDDCLNVTSISFVPTVNSKGESVYIEALKDRSIFIARSVPNYELFNFNLFIGLLGYDSKTEEEKITFKVKKANIKNAGLDENSIKLYRWSTEKRIWIRKYTDLVNSDEYFYYYESDSGTTSGSFAVSGTEFIPEEPSFIEEFIQKIPGLEDVDLTIPDVVKDGYGNLGVVIVFILSSLVIGAVSIYYNSGKWVISMMISVLLIGIIYIFLGSNMVSIFNSNIINLLINAALISLLSCLSPGIFEGIKEKLEAN